MADVRLDRVMRLRGAMESPGPDAEAAARRCANCGFTALCDEALAASDVKALALFCPNSHYIQQVRSRSLRFM
jgi:hypothetical protein